MVSGLRRFGGEGVGLLLERHQVFDQIGAHPLPCLDGEEAEDGEIGGGVGVEHGAWGAQVRGVRQHAAQGGGFDPVFMVLWEAVP